MPTSASSQKHTTHIAAADAEGNWVAITQTVNTAFGSKVIVPGTGVVLNNEMDDFSIAPGTPNAFGLSAPRPTPSRRGKRPLSSMSPTIVLRRRPADHDRRRRRRADDHHAGRAGDRPPIDLGLPLDQALAPAANPPPMVARRGADRIAAG